MILVAVIATVIVRPNRKLDYTIYKDVSMSDEELLDYKSTVPWDIHRHVDVEDMANLSSSVDAFRVSMDDFMDLKQKVLQSNMDMETDFSRESRKIINLELEEINKALLKKRKEVSRCFGVFFMELFQALMEATKKNVAIRKKKTLHLTLTERAKMSQPLYDRVVELEKKGIVRLHDTKKGEGREVGFVRSKKNGGIDTSNSVRKYEDLNCKICNHKLDPLYVLHLQKYLNYKINNPSQRGELDYDDDDNDAKMNYEKQCTVINGRAV